MAEKAMEKRTEEASAAQSRDLGRRRLLRGLANGGGALALVGLAGEALPSGSESRGGESAAGHTQLGFEAIDHVRWYYARARW